MTLMKKCQVHLTLLRRRALFFFIFTLSFNTSLSHSHRLFRIQHSKNNAMIFIFIHQNSLIFHGISFAHTCITVRIRRKLRDFSLPLLHCSFCPPAVSRRYSNPPSNFIKTSSRRSHSWHES